MNKRDSLLLATGVLAAAATAFFLLREKKRNAQGKPPRKAPQLKLENPGSQSDFPVAPSDSAIG